MDLLSAFSIYGLNNSDFTREELDKGFKKLVKKYHPDKNRDFADWCHERMTEINEAYEILMDFLETRTSSPHRGSDNTRRNKKQSPKTNRREHSGSSFYRKATALYFEGVHIYYDYELTKRSLRQEGVWRYHYRKSIKMMEKSLGEIEKRVSSEALGEGWSNFMHFGQLFLEDIQSFEPEIPLSMKGSKPHITYKEASASMDKALASYFSSDGDSREKHLSPLYRASHLLILLVENYPRTEWYSLALQKLNLLDAFLDLQDLIRAGKITF